MMARSAYMAAGLINVIAAVVEYAYLQDLVLTAVFIGFAALAYTIGMMSGADMPTPNGATCEPAEDP